MSFKSTLEIHGAQSGTSSFDVLSCNYNFMRNTDPRGMPTSGLLDGFIYVELESSDSTKFFPMISSNEVISGKLTFYKPDSDQKLKEIKFTHAHIVKVYESMVSTGSIPMKVNITITAQEIEMDGGKISWNWNNGSRT